MLSFYFPFLKDPFTFVCIFPYLVLIFAISSTTCQFSIVLFCSLYVAFFGHCSFSPSFFWFLFSIFQSFISLALFAFLLKVCFACLLLLVYWLFPLTQNPLIILDTELLWDPASSFIRALKSYHTYRIQECKGLVYLCQEAHYCQRFES